jgi:hypothetical protein
MLSLRAAGTVAIVAPLSVAFAACGLDASGLDARPLDAGGENVAPDSATAVDGSDSPDSSPPDAPVAPDAAQTIDASPPPDSGSVGPVTVSVPATSGIGCPPFFASGVTVPAGSTLKLTATGSWSYRTGFWCGADGTTTPLGSVNGSPYGELLAQFAGGAAFAVGSSYSTTVAQGGTLAFGINDDQCTGNYGSVSVTITVTP